MAVEIRPQGCAFWARRTPPPDYQSFTFFKILTKSGEGSIKGAVAI